MLKHIIYRIRTQGIYSTFVVVAVLVVLGVTGVAGATPGFDFLQPASAPTLVNY